MATEKEKIKRAAYLAESLTGEDATYKEVNGHKLPKVAVEIGRLEEVIYSVIENGIRIYYKHTWKNKKPTLATSDKGIGIFILGGKQIVTERGIID